MKKFLFDCGTRDNSASLGILALRVMIGSMMLFGHGIPKILDFDNLKKFFYVPEFLPIQSEFLPLHWPTISLAACIGAEVVAAGFIILGLATRHAAFVLGFAMVVASFGRNGATPWFLKNSPNLIETKELSLMYLIPMIAIILAGAGRYSLDAVFCQEDRRRRW